MCDVCQAVDRVNDRGTAALGVDKDFRGTAPIDVDQWRLILSGQDLNDDELDKLRGVSMSTAEHAVRDVALGHDPYAVMSSLMLQGVVLGLLLHDVKDEHSPSIDASMIDGNALMEAIDEYARSHRRFGCCPETVELRNAVKVMIDR